MEWSACYQVGAVWKQGVPEATVCTVCVLPRWEKDKRKGVGQGCACVCYLCCAGLLLAQLVRPWLSRPLIVLKRRTTSDNVKPARHTHTHTPQDSSRCTYTHDDATRPCTLTTAPWPLPRLMLLDKATLPCPPKRSSTIHLIRLPSPPLPQQTHPHRLC